MSFPASKRTPNPPLSRNNNSVGGGRPLSRPTSRSNLHATFVNASVGTSANGSTASSSSGSTASSSVDEQPVRSTSVVPSAIVPPVSPSKERIRMAGIRADGVGGGHFKQKGDEQSNIQVVVRVRGRAPQEDEPLQPILSTSGPHCSSINIAMELAAPLSAPSTSALSSVQSSLVSDRKGGVRERTYPFDHVFGPEADQGMVYQSVVGPVLNEVLSGYNCTIFAYGQTGTGKTHTMEGDLTALVGTYSPEAGIIPRTLFRLFHTLELSKDEYSVHASFVELYNEELRDLLSDDAPQPLSNAGGGTSVNGLRMYEDKSKGVVIQGLEDVPMRDAEHGLRLLRKGSQKRQIAATRCNESSSRSHCVFTLTIHIKETTAKGEDVVRTGKLNLVDLAGSENIGRSGAENKRAREAGMINQSLLTLGRVINALVEKSSHVPYRESKLTRLLQESLGGRTKTCIIATVSPERDNMEETLSTLDYALRAKSIRNKPEVNQRMTRAALIKEYVNEIERLKGDLLASREKNGIFLSPESWQMMQDEHDGTRAQVEDLRRQGEVVGSKMASLKEQFEQNMQLLVKREAEAKAVRTECTEKEQEVSRILQRIEDLQQAEEEERALRQAYMRSEKRLDGVARNLRTLFNESSSDVDGLFAKLERKSKVDRKNRDLMAECQAALASMSNQLEARVSDFASGHEQFTMDLSAQLKEFQKREMDKLRANRASVDHRLQKVQALTRSAGDEHKQAKAKVDFLSDSIRKDGEELLAASQDRNEALKAILHDLAQQVASSHRDSMGSIRAGVEEFGEVVLGVMRMAKERAATDRKTIEDVRAISTEATQTELERLTIQNEALTRLLAEERDKAGSMRDALCKNIGQMINSFCQQREQVFVHALDDARRSNEQAQNDVRSFAHQHGSRTEELLESNQSLRETLKEKERAIKAQRIRNESGFTQSGAGLDRHIHEFAATLTNDGQEREEHTERQIRAISQNVEEILATAEASRQAESKHLADVRLCAEEGFTEVAAELHSTLEDVEETCEMAIEGVEEHQVLGSTFLEEQNSQLMDLRSTAKDYLSGAKIHIDLPTGMTPQKKEWPNIANWSLVQPARLGNVAGSVDVQTGKEAAHQSPLHPDDSMANVEGDLATMREEVASEAQKFGNEGQDERIKDFEEGQKARDAFAAIAVRPSMPEPSTAAAPLKERQMNRHSSALPKMKPALRSVSTSHPRTNGNSKLRLPSSVSHSTQQSKKARKATDH